MRVTADNQPRTLDWGTLTGPDKVAANLCVLLRLQRGEVPYDRMRGLDPGIAGQGIVGNEADVRREVDRLMRWEPNARLEGLRINYTQDGALHVSMDAEVSA